MSNEVFPFATVGVANYAMTRTGPGKALIQEEVETRGTNMKANYSLKQSCPSLPPDP